MFILPTVRTWDNATKVRIQGETYNLTVWSGAEDFIIIVCGSIPTLKPLWDRYIVENKSHHFSRVTMPPASAPKGNGSKGIVVFTDINVNNGPKSLV